MPTMPSRLPVTRMAEHAGRRPAGPFARTEQFLALADPPRHAQDQRHDHVGGVVGQHPRRIGDDDVLRARGGQVEVIDPGTEIGDQLEPRSGAGDDVRGQVVGDCRHQHVGAGAGIGEPRGIHRDVVEVQLDIEQLGHPRLDRLRQAAGDDNLRAGARHKVKG
jgi:hypothetical protein